MKNHESRSLGQLVSAPTVRKQMVMNACVELTYIESKVLDPGMVSPTHKWDPP